MPLISLAIARRVCVILILGACLSLCAWQLANTWQQVVESGHTVALDPRLNIDGTHYYNSGKRFVEKHLYIFTTSTYTSVGMKILMACCIRLSLVHALLIFKALNYLAWSVTIALAALLTFQIRKSVSAALLTLVLVTSSSALQTYTTLIQYEVLAAFFIILIIFLILRARPIPSFTAGILIGLLAVIRPHFMLFAPGYFLYFFFQRRRREAWYLLAGFLLFAIPWNVYYTVKSGYAFFFYAIKYGYATASILTEKSSGRNYPPSPLCELHGLKFVLAKPGAYLALLGRRFPYLIGYHSDFWMIDSWTGRLLEKVFAVSNELSRRIVAVGGLSLFICGIFSLARRRPRLALCCLIAVAGTLSGQLLVNSSTRFIVPLLPVIIIFQTSFFSSLYDFTKNLPTLLRRRYVSSSRHPREQFA